MSIAHERPEGEVPWYLLKSSILMISVTVLAILAIAFDYTTRDPVPAGGYRIVDNGTIVNGGGPEIHRE